MAIIANIFNEQLLTAEKGDLQLGAGIWLRTLYHKKTTILRRVGLRFTRADDIKVDVREIGPGCMEWIDLAQGRNRVDISYEHGNEISDSKICRDYPQLLLFVKDSAPWRSLASIFILT
jgi:hypothetical protein